MTIEARYVSRGLSGGLPAISTSESYTRSRGSRPSPPSASSPMAMSIPSASTNDEPPPPLPPPRFVPVDGPIAYEPPFRDHDDNFSPVERDSYKFRDRLDRVDHDEGYHSIGSSARTLNSPHFSMHNTFQFRPRADAYDSSMLDKLNARRPLENRSPIQWSALSTSARDHHNRPTPMQLPKLLSLPDRTRMHPQPTFDSPHRYTQTPVTSAVSPRYHSFKYGSAHPGDHRSPIYVDSGDYDRSPYRRGRDRRNSGSVPDDATVSTQGSSELRDDETDFPMEETSRLHMLNIEDACREGRERTDRGQKRRASSPPEDVAALTASDMLRRRDMNAVARGSPTPRLSTIPQSSVSSVSSGGRSATSYTSMNTAASMTSLGSFERRSPNGPSPVSPGDSSGFEAGSPYAASVSLGSLSRRSSNSRGMPTPQQQQQLHQRTLSEVSAIAQGNRATSSPQKVGVQPPKSTGMLSAKMQGFFMCECCPKKPKKFETREELSAHEAEKQYECSFCGNRFKNKNEAERHQNSLHVRRHSWSCSALTGYERAFHDSATCPGEVDVCGYCGEEFRRGGNFAPTPPGAGRYITDDDWNKRVRHLQDVHKFRECNASKKFYRADHFRQHLKHSHAGTSGKWTNLLENACMIEEEPPVISR